LLNVDVLERDDPNVLDEPSGTVHVPYPGIRHAHFEIHLATVLLWLYIHGVGQVETSLGLHTVGELADNVAVLAVQRQFHLRLVPLETLRTHAAPRLLAGRNRSESQSVATSPFSPSFTHPRSRLPYRPTWGNRRCRHAASDTFRYEY